MPTQKQLIQSIADEIQVIKTKLPNGEILRIQEALVALEEGQSGLKGDIREIKRRILDPEEGLVVRVNKNTEFRHHRGGKMAQYKDDGQKLYEVLSWKDTVTKALWVVYSSLIALAIKLIFWN